VRDRTHWNSPNIKAQHPVGLGLCTLQELDAAVAKAQRRRRAEGGVEEAPEGEEFETAPASPEAEGF
jgi:uncharacterized protein